MNNENVVKEKLIENEMNWPIKRNTIYHTYVIATDGVNCSSRKMIFTGEEPFYLSKNIDLLYETPQYNRVYRNHKQKHCHELRIGVDDKILSLQKLLEYFGFPDQMYLENINSIFSTLMNGKFPFLYCKEFGYKKKEVLQWKNGVLVSDSTIQNLSDYDLRKYELIDKSNELALFFSILGEVNFKNPEASFMPLEEEGIIRKRALESRDKNV